MYLIARVFVFLTVTITDVYSFVDTLFCSVLVYLVYFRLFLDLFRLFLSSRSDQPTTNWYRCSYQCVAPSSHMRAAVGDHAMPCCAMLCCVVSG